MKALCSLVTITLLTSQAYAGTILPDLSRSRSEANTSPVAVGFSNRNSGNIMYTRATAEAETSGVETYEEKIRNINGSLFATTPKLHMEFTADFSDDDLDFYNPATTDISGDTYAFGASLAMPFADTFSAGVSVNASRVTALASGVKGINNIVTITPAFGMKFMPNMAAGLGVRHEMNKFKTVVVGTSVTELPSFSSDEIFLGVAYGVDQKIGENGFGAEVVVTHTPKSKEQEGALIIAQGTTTGVEVSGNFTQDKLDVGVTALWMTGDNYFETASKEAHAVVLRPEYLITESIYVAPTLTYTRQENTTDFGTDNNVTEKAFLYGAGVGHRTTMCDLELTYNHGTQDLTPGSFDLDSNTFAGRISFYF